MLNDTGSVIVFRDDAGKHHVKNGEEFEIVGDQHIPAVLDAMERARNARPRRARVTDRAGADDA